MKILQCLISSHSTIIGSDLVKVRDVRPAREGVRKVKGTKKYNCCIEAPGIANMAIITL